MAGTSPAMTEFLLFFTLAVAAPLHVVAIGPIALAVGCHLHALPAGEDDESDQNHTAENANDRLHQRSSRQLASASSDNCRGCGSVWDWSVRWGGLPPVK